MREDKWCIVVVGAAFVLVVDFRHVRRLFVCCWLGCRSRGDGDRELCWMLESAAYKVAFYRVPFRDILYHCESSLTLRSSTHLWPVFLASSTLSSPRHNTEVSRGGPADAPSVVVLSNASELLAIHATAARSVFVTFCRRLRGPPWHVHHTRSRTRNRSVQVPGRKLTPPAEP